MNCRKVCSLLSAYMDGELTGVESLRIRRHLGECDACSREHESLLATKLAVCGMPLAEPDPEFEQRLMCMVANMPPETGWRKRIVAPFVLNGPRNRVRVAAAFAAAALLALAVSIRWTLDAPTAAASMRLASPQMGKDPLDIGRERDLRFVHETFERPQPVSYRAAPDELPFERGPAAHPVTVWDRAEPVSSP